MAIGTHGLLPQTTRSEDTNLCVLTDDPAVLSAVKLGFPAGIVVQHYETRGLVDRHHVLSAHGLAVIEAARSSDALLVEWRLDLAPVLNTLGFHLRTQPQTPLVALCRHTPQEEVAALAAGCDAALTFPIEPALLQSIVLAHRRLIASVRASVADPERVGPDAKPDEQVFGPLRLNRSACRLFVNDAEVQLTPREYSLLDYLLRRPDQLCTRDDILNQVWGINFDTGTNMVDVYMYFLRRKLEAHAAADMIQTVRGRGYRLARPGGPAVTPDVGRMKEGPVGQPANEP